jgi:hypothetical protein
MASYEIGGWPKEVFLAVINEPTPNQFAPERKVWCDWPTRYLEAEALADREYPYAPGCGAFPVYIAIEPAGKMDTTQGAVLGNYKKAVITVRYSTARSTADAIAEYIVGTQYRESTSMRGLVDDSGNPIQRGDAPQHIQDGCVFNHIRFKLPVVPGNILTMGNRVNANTIYCPTLDIWFAAGTLKSMFPRISRTWSTSGLRPYLVHQTFLYKYSDGFGWNSVYDPTTGTYSPVYYDGSRVYQYPLANFTLA